jgi:hypothetical protein
VWCHGGGAASRIRMRYRTRSLIGMSAQFGMPPTEVSSLTRTIYICELPTAAEGFGAARTPVITSQVASRLCRSGIPSWDGRTLRVPLPARDHAGPGSQARLPDRASWLMLIRLRVLAAGECQMGDPARAADRFHAEALFQSLQPAPEWLSAAEDDRHHRDVHVIDQIGGEELAVR